MQTVRPDLNAIKARLGSLSPSAISRITQQSHAVATLLVDCKHLVAYVEELERRENPIAEAMQPWPRPTRRIVRPGIDVEVRKS